MLRKDINLSLLRMYLFGAMNWSLEWVKPGKLNAAGLATVTPVTATLVEAVALTALLAASDPLRLALATNEVVAQVLFTVSVKLTLPLDPAARSPRLQLMVPVFSLQLLPPLQPT